MSIKVYCTGKMLLQVRISKRLVGLIGIAAYSGLPPFVSGTRVRSLTVDSILVFRRSNLKKSVGCYML